MPDHLSAGRTGQEVVKDAATACADVPDRPGHIKVVFSCPRCGLVNEVAYVEARRPMEDLERWMKKCNRAVHVRHAVKSMTCDLDEKIALVGDGRRLFWKADSPELTADCDRFVPLDQIPESGGYPPAWAIKRLAHFLPGTHTVLAENKSPVFFSADALESSYKVPTVAEINRAAKQADPNPSHGRRESGLYAKGHISIHGLKIAIENAKGSYRQGVSSNGKIWRNKMRWPYGYLKRTEGGDGEHIDCFLGPHPQSEVVFIIDQKHQDGSFDEHKVFIGWTNAKDAKRAYLLHYPPTWTGFGSITAMTVADFKKWLEEGDTSAPMATLEGRESVKAILSKPSTNLLEEGFTGTITDKRGAKRRYVNGKEVPMGDEEDAKGKPQPSASPTAQLNGQNVTTVAHDPAHGLAKVKTPDGSESVVKTGELDFSKATTPEKSPTPDAPEIGRGDSVPVGETLAKAAHFLHEKGSEGFKHLPTEVKAGATRVCAVAFLAWTASQKLAEEVALEIGAGPDEAMKLSSSMAAADIAMFKPVAMATAPMGPVVGAATWIVPPVTGVYLAKSLVKHPMATFRAASNLIGDLASSMPKLWKDDAGTQMESKENPVHLSAAHGALLKALQEHKFDDWYVALVHAALLHTTDVVKAIQLADAAFEKQPEDESKPQDDDAEALFGKAAEKDTPESLERPGIQRALLGGKPVDVIKVDSSHTFARVKMAHGERVVRVDALDFTD